MMKFLALILAFNLFCVFAYAQDEPNEDDIEELERRFNLFNINRADYCLSAGDCKGDEYCDLGMANKCRRKGNNGDPCVYDNRCLSGSCRFFRCQAPHTGSDEVEPDGWCESDKNCRTEQYCRSYKCTDRLEEGSTCLRDSQCASNYCSRFKCRNPVTPSEQK